MHLPFSTPHCTVGAFNRCCRRRARIDFPAGKGSHRLSHSCHNPLPAPFASFPHAREEGFLRGDDKNDPLFGGFSSSPPSKTSVFPGRKEVNRGKPTEKWCLFLMLAKGGVICQQKGARFLELPSELKMVPFGLNVRLRRSGASPTLRRRPTCGRRPRSERCRAR